MRQYAALHAGGENWSVIFRDGFETEWYIYAKDIGDQERCNEVAEALNEVGRRYE